MPSAERSGTGRLRPEKRAAILAGGREVFVRSGFSGASIDAIAAASGVSTRTIYKHFTDKAAVCAAVIADSAARVAKDETALVDHHLSAVTTADEVEPALLRFATAWLSSTAPSADDRTLMGRVHDEAEQLDPTVVQAWWEAGPGQVLGALATALGRWDELGLLRAPAPDIVAMHFSALVSAAPGPPLPADVDADVRAAWIRAGVEAFVRAYRG